MESGVSIDDTTTTCDYDNRGRLVSELRWVPGSPVYYLLYEYDQRGNRTRRVDLENDREIVYEYDIDDPGTYGSDNNRLMYYEVIEPIGGDPVDDVQSTTYYEYNDVGNVTRVVTHEEGTTHYSRTRLIYASNGSTVAYVTGETWDSTDPDGTYNITYAREFRYDGARARYLVRELDPAGLLLDPPQFNPVPGGDVWSDYEGDIIYGDFTADAGTETITNTRSYQPGIGRVDDPFGTPVPEYYHADLIGSTRMMSDASGYAVAGSAAAYTAFGELVPGSANHRYGYAGAWGYQTHEEFPFQHVGHRYHDPATGRFLQRDPIGIHGGFNVYAYAESSPLAGVDPSGRGPYADKTEEAS